MYAEIIKDKLYYMIKETLAHLILINYEKVSSGDKIEYASQLAYKFAPMAIFLNFIGLWWHDNHQFGMFMMGAMLINLVIGVFFHHRNKSLDIKEMLVKSGEMSVIVIATYTILEMIRYTLGDNMLSEAFRATIQVATILYPGSKIFKNCYLLSNGKFPPKFVMENIYNFEKNGDLRRFINFKKDNDERNE